MTHPTQQKIKVKTEGPIAFVFCFALAVQKTKTIGGVIGENVRKMAKNGKKWNFKSTHLGDKRYIIL